ncbi:MAG TPA: aldo/keto reductase [Pseudonocardiaceae bacterium]|nr:aldo/keto reductase [Pseudonocardiaceae bacterium]
MTDLDTAYNYRDFTSHRRLAATAGDLLSEFTISTKVGFFPGSRGPEHCLDPMRLRQAVHQSLQDLGVQPHVVLLHNPERTLAELTPEQGRERWAAACTALHDMAAAGWCRSWGVSCWDPRRVLAVLDRTLPVPAYVMVRAGLLVSADILDASEELATWLNLDAHSRWGMSPYGGQATHAVWDEVDARQFLRRSQYCSRIPAAFRVAYEVPQVSRVAVSTSSGEHLADLVAATALDTDDSRIARYRSLLRAEALTAEVH